MRLTPIGRRGLLAGSAAGGLWGLAARSWAKAIGYPRLLQGPMVGAPGPDRITVWGRTTGSFDVQLEYATDRDFRDATLTSPVRAGPETDFCVKLTAEGLKPATRYYYRLKLEGGYDRYQPLPYWTKTAPAGPADFRVAFGSCCRFSTDPEQRIFTAAMALEPDLFFWLGDNVYVDSDEPAAMADHYRRQRTIDRLQPLLRTVPSLAIWDDHDFAYNDSDRMNPIRDPSLGIFANYWANPAYGLPGTPGVFFKLAYGGVDFFFLDGRYHRDPRDAPAGPAKTMLGGAQKTWLKRELKASRAPFKILVSGTGWSMAEKGGDSWAGYVHERDELFDFIRDQKITGVVGISGDSHMGELNCVPRSEQGGYDVYDLCSSPLAQLPDNDFVDQAPEVRIRPAWGRSVNVGVLAFRAGPEPTLTFTLHNPLGDAVWKPLVLTPADLRNGVQSWRSKIDAKELERLERYRAGGPYYAPEA